MSDSFDAKVRLMLRPWGASRCEASREGRHSPAVDIDQIATIVAAKWRIPAAVRADVSQSVWAEYLAVLPQLGSRGQVVAWVVCQARKHHRRSQRRRLRLRYNSAEIQGMATCVDLNAVVEARRIYADLAAFARDKGYSQTMCLLALGLSAAEITRRTGLSSYKVRQQIQALRACRSQATCSPFRTRDGDRWAG